MCRLHKKSPVKTGLFCFLSQTKCWHAKFYIAPCSAAYCRQKFLPFFACRFLHHGFVFRLLYQNKIRYAQNFFHFKNFSANKKSAKKRLFYKKKFFKTILQTPYPHAAPKVPQWLPAQKYRLPAPAPCNPQFYILFPHSF